MSEHEFYGDLVHKFRKIIAKTEVQFEKIVNRYKR